MIYNFKDEIIYNMSITQYECTLCTENMEDNDRIICPHCSIEICESCFQYSVTMEEKDPSCIYCKNPISIEFILSNNTTKWCKNTFLTYYSDLLLEKEKAKLVETIPKYRIIKDINQLKKSRQELLTNKKIENNVKKLNLVKDEFESKFKELIQKRNDEKKNLTISIEELENKININNKKEKKEKCIYITKCPNLKCKGFINSKYTCELCDTKICKACFMLKEDNHVCNRDDIESADLIKKESKSCPGCYVPIFKLSGCNQMFCTNCNTVFNWVTLEIDKGKVHNQHYFDYISSIRNSSEQIRIENAACGNIDDLYPRIIKYTRNTYIHNFYILINELHEEIIPIYRNNFKDKFEEYRIKYLSNSLSQLNWKKNLMKDTIHNEANNSYIEILEMYVTVSNDLIRKLCFEIDDILTKEEKEAKKVIISIFTSFNSLKYNNENLEFKLKNECEKNNFYIDQESRYFLLDYHLRHNIDWNNIDLSKHNLLDEINITITNLSSLIDFRSYVTNHIVFSKHFHKCLDDTYQTFGIDLIKNTKMIILKDLLKKYYY